MICIAGSGAVQRFIGAEGLCAGFPAEDGAGDAAADQHDLRAAGKGSV